MITANELAAEIGIDKSNLLKAARKLGVHPQKKVLGLHGQPEAVFSDEEAAVMRERYRHRLRK